MQEQLGCMSWATHVLSVLSPRGFTCKASRIHRHFCLPALSLSRLMMDGPA